MRREIEHSQAPQAAQDGAGVKINRLFPVGGLDNIDPFLLFDHFGSDKPGDYLAGFPMHPHRGIETVTYMLEGTMEHKDSTGRQGILTSGDVQWMSAGRGIMHEEMPKQKEGRMAGFQLWVNLAARDKMNPPDYQEYRAEEITKFAHEGNQISLITGELLGYRGVVDNVSTVPLYADITLAAGRLTLNLPEHHHAFVYVFEGETQVVNASDEKQAAVSPRLLILSDGDELVFKTAEYARVMLAAAQKIEEPIVRWGPFVMNTREEIEQTLAEVREGRFPPQ